MLELLELNQGLGVDHLGWHGTRRHLGLESLIVIFLARGENKQARSVVIRAPFIMVMAMVVINRVFRLSLPRERLLGKHELGLACWLSVGLVVIIRLLGMATSYKSLLCIHFFMIIFIKVITIGNIIIVDHSVGIVVISVRNHKLAIVPMVAAFEQVALARSFVVLVSVVVGGAKEGSQVLRA